MIGYPIDAATSLASSMEPSGDVVPGTIGTPAAAMILRDSVLLPIASIDEGGGPIQTRPAAITARAKSAFSERKP